MLGFPFPSKRDRNWKQYGNRINSNKQIRIFDCPQFYFPSKKTSKLFQKKKKKKKNPFKVRNFDSETVNLKAHSQTINRKNTIPVIFLVIKIANKATKEQKQISKADTETAFHL